MEKSATGNLNPVLIKAILLATSFFSMLNETAVNVALSSLMTAFGVSINEIQWMVTGFMLVMAVIIPMSAFIIKSYSIRRIYFASLIILLIGGFLAGFAVNFQMALVGRLIQAAGTCCFMSLTVNGVLALTPPQERGMAMGLVGLVTLFAPAFAPSLAGVVLQFLGWRWIFLVSTPIFVILGIVAFAGLKNFTQPSKQHFDVPSVILSILAFGGILWGISSIGQDTSHSVNIWVLFAVGFVALVIFIIRQLTFKHPLLDLRVFKYPMFAVSMIMILFYITDVFGVTILTPMFMEKVIGAAAAIIGLAMLPGGILNGLASIVFGKLYDKFGPKALIITGTLLVLIANLLFAFLPAGIPLGIYIVIHCLLLVAVGMVMTIAQANGLNEVPQREHPHATAIQSTVMQFAGGIGSAVFVALLAMGQLSYHSANGVVNSHELFASGFHLAFLVAAIGLIIPFILSFFVYKPVHEKQPS